MAKLFIDEIFSASSSSPSTVRLSVPVVDSDDITVYGLMAGDPTFSASTKWGPIVNDISNLTDFSSIGGQKSLFSWISASVQCWKGTAPLSLQFEFYMINYSPDLDIKSKLASLVNLAAVQKSGEDGFLGRDLKIRVHGGYTADVLEGNTSFWNSKDALLAWKLQNAKAKDATEESNNRVEAEKHAKRAEDSLSNIQGNVIPGVATVSFGNKMRIANLLLSKIDFTQSTIEVAEQDGSNPQPLYYRVNVSFIGSSTFSSSDVSFMFN